MEVLSLKDSLKAELLFMYKIIDSKQKRAQRQEQQKGKEGAFIDYVMTLTDRDHY